MGRHRTRPRPPLTTMLLLWECRAVIRPASRMCQDDARCILRSRAPARSLRGFLLGETFERLFEDWIVGRFGLAELHVGCIHGHRWLEAFLVQRIAGRGEVLRRGDPDAGSIRQLHELLLAGATDRVFADNLGALVSDERG